MMPGPYEVCPCGSLKKYKWCHMKGDAATARQFTSEDPRVQTQRTAAGFSIALPMDNLTAFEVAPFVQEMDEAGFDVDISTLPPGGTP